MELLEFANFIGDGTYGFVVTAFQNNMEVQNSKTNFRKSAPVTHFEF
jgi:hypothetical protein